MKDTYNNKRINDSSPAPHSSAAELSKRFLQEEIIDWFMPINLLSRSDHRTHLLARRHIIVFLSALATMIILFLIGFALADFNNHTLFIGGAITMISFIAIMTGLNIFKYSGSFVISGNTLAATCFVAISCSVFYTGGFSGSPSLPLLFAIPALASLSTGMRSAMVWLILSIAVTASFYYANHLDIEFEAILAPYPMEYFYWISFVTVVIFNTSSFLLYIRSISHTRQIHPPIDMRSMR